MGADVIEGSADARIDAGGGMFRIGEGAAQQDFFERIHSECLALRGGTGVDLQHFLIATFDSGLLFVALKLEMENTRRDLGPVECFAPIGPGDKVSPERFPMRIARSRAVVVASMRF